LNKADAGTLNHEDARISLLLIIANFLILQRLKLIQR